MTAKLRLACLHPSEEEDGGGGGGGGGGDGVGKEDTHSQCSSCCLNKVLLLSLRGTRSERERE